MTSDRSTNVIAHASFPYVSPTANDVRPLSGPTRRRDLDATWCRLTDRLGQLQSHEGKRTGDYND